MNVRLAMITQETIAEVTRRLVKLYQPSKIYLFGSYAWGSPTEDSDLDIFIIVDESQEKSHRRGIPASRVLWGLDISKDILVYTQKEFDERVDHPSTLCHLIQQKGKVLYARA
jgi:predicted nucleotidyltransferase